ncbi:hypothetical protein MNEG_11090, partial [Monoraphidium neglectum]
APAPPRRRSRGCRAPRSRWPRSGGPTTAGRWSPLTRRAAWPSGSSPGAAAAGAAL